MRRHLSVLAALFVLGASGFTAAAFAGGGWRHDHGHEGTTGTSSTQSSSSSSSSTTSTTTPSSSTTTTTPSTSTTGREPKELLCHRTGSWKHPWTVISVARSAVPAHMRHGDTMDDGGCQGTTSSTTSTTTPTTSTTEHAPKVLMCHRLDSGRRPWVVIAVSRGDVRARMRDGDDVDHGTCGVSHGVQGTSTTSSSSSTSSTSSTVQSTTSTSTPTTTTAPTTTSQAHPVRHSVECLSVAYVKRHGKWYRRVLGVMLPVKAARHHR